ncbi:uncharacterized protein LOC130675640 [Microplitis mediator]|uniref:uncharacterized protein LOC130675640 n=1 Tax=Microplitis mediator TaxID=375433 RepID=UPI00255632E4|nr:uncharacterized protein LOC130675640 [Microplitis mediator]XP_057337415.1 uncharacterized protein LOC130675640 [Microplitis mediator]
MESNNQPGQITKSSPDECIFVTDRESQITYLINPCYSGSFFPRSLLPKRLGPNTETITLSLDLGFERKFLWEFRVTDVDQPTLDTDFIAHYGLFVNQKNLKLEDPTANSSSDQQVEESNEQPSQQTTSEVDDNHVHIFDQTSNNQPDQITNSSPDECIFVTDRESQITYLINRCYSAVFFLDHCYQSV